MFTSCGPNEGKSTVTMNLASCDEQKAARECYSLTVI